MRQHLVVVAGLKKFKAEGGRGQVSYALFAYTRQAKGPGFKQRLTILPPGMGQGTLAAVVRHGELKNMAGH